MALHPLVASRAPQNAQHDKASAQEDQQTRQKLAHDVERLWQVDCGNSSSFKDEMMRNPRAGSLTTAITLQLESRRFACPVNSIPDVITSNVYVAP